jgi:hypothetical protein
MHPIERLRFIARAEDEPPSSLAMEAAYTLADLSNYEPNAVLTACRRLLDKHPECGPLWWVGAQLVGAGDPFEVARRAGGELCSDPTADRLAEALRASFAGDETFVLGQPCDVTVEALQRARPAVVHVLGSGFTLRRAIHRAAAAVEDVIGYMEGEEDEAVAGAAVVLIEPLAAGETGCLVTPESAGLVGAAAEAHVAIWLVAGVGRLLPETLFQAVVERTAGAEPASAEFAGYDSFNLAIAPDGSGRPARLETLAREAVSGSGLELLRRPV